MPSRRYCSRKPSSSRNCGLPVDFADHAVEGEVFRHAVAPVGDGSVDGLQRAPQRGDLRAGGALGGQRGDLALEHAPHLDHVHHRLHRVQHGGVEGQRLIAAAAARRTRPSPGATAPVPLRLELVHRLAHHGARDAVRGRELLLGGQPVAGLQRAGFDLRAQARRQPVRQPIDDQLLGLGGGGRPHGGGGMSSVIGSSYKSAGVDAYRFALMRGPIALPILRAATARRSRVAARPLANSQDSVHGQCHDPGSQEELRRCLRSCMGSTSTSRTARSPCWWARRAAASRRCCA